jgi:hypothetical protein
VVNVIREHPRTTSLLFVGTEHGLFVSYDRGGSWRQLRQNLPTVPVDDILIHPRDNDLILGTHGRSIWILDDLTPLEQMSDTVMKSKVHLFAPRETTMWRTWNNKPLTSDKAFYGQNPPNGAMINFYLDTPLVEREIVTITIADSKGQTIRTQNCTRPNPNQQQGGGQGGPGGGGGGGGFGFGFGGAAACNPTAGLNRWVWDLRYRPVTPQGPSLTGPGGAQAAGEGPAAAGPGGAGFGNLANLGFRVDPGDYVVKIKRGDVEMSHPIKVVEDPRIEFSAADRATKRAALTKMFPFVMQAQQAQQGIVQLRTNLNAAIESWRRPGGPRVPQNIREAAEALLKKVDEAYKNWGTPPSLQSNISAAGPPLVELPQPLNQRAAQLLTGMENTSGPPTEWELAQIEILSKRIPTAAAEVRQLITVDLAALNKMAIDAQVPLVQPPFFGGGQGQRPPGSEEDYDQ